MHRNMFICGYSVYMQWLRKDFKSWGFLFNCRGIDFSNAKIDIKYIFVVYVCIWYLYIYGEKGLKILM